MTADRAFNGLQGIVKNGMKMPTLPSNWNICHQRFGRSSASSRLTLWVKS
jgi:hypothetical protein